MRCTALLTSVAAAAALAGCVYTGAYHDAGYSISNNPYIADIPPRPVYPQYVLTFPDETMYFYPMFQDEPRHADLRLDAIRCVSDGTGHVAVIATLSNLGSNIVPAIPLLSGDLGAFRVGAIATTSRGTHEQVYATQFVPLTVAHGVSLATASLAAPAGDIVRIDVEVDPDRIVPDPLRDNNVLTWQGAMQSADPQCTMRR